MIMVSGVENQYDFVQLLFSVEVESRTTEREELTKSSFSLAFSAGGFVSFFHLPSTYYRRELPKRSTKSVRARAPPCWVFGVGKRLIARSEVCIVVCLCRD